jgi:PAP2 superfamily
MTREQLEHVLRAAARIAENPDVVADHASRCHRGHAAVSAALASGAHAVLPALPGATAVAAAVVVGFARIYVGAHLPMDVLGGAAFGWTLDAAIGKLLF